jgi:hypothetical protein
VPRMRTVIIALVSILFPMAQAVVTHEDDEYLDYHGQIIRSRFRMTDTWIRTPGGWRELASQVLAVLRDPPARKLDTKVLCEYSGNYELTADIRGTLKCDKDELVFDRPARESRRFRPELLDVFFEPATTHPAHFRAQ